MQARGVLTGAQQQLQREQCLHRTDHADDRTEDAGFFAGFRRVTALAEQTGRSKDRPA